MWHADIVGPTPFQCELCMATGPAADPCPYHDENTWDEWLTAALREFVWATCRNLVYRPRDPRVLGLVETS